LAENNQHNRFFYGWYIVAASFGILFFNSGARYAFGVMMKPIIAEFGWSRGAVSAVFFVNMAVFALALFIVGKLYDRFGPRWVILVSTLFIAAGFALTSFINSLGQFFFSYGILAALGMAGTSVPMVATLTSKWFDKWRGLAISLAISGNSIGQFALIPLFSSLVLNLGWRSSYLYIGTIMLVVNTALAWLVIKGDPAHLGLMPFGRDKAEAKTKDLTHEIGTGTNIISPDMNLKQAMGTSSFWLFLIVMAICGSGDYFATTHLIPLATDYGIAPLVAGKMLGLYGLMSLAGILIAGPAADFIGSKIPIILTFTLRICLYMLILRYKSAMSFYVFALAFGFTHLITAPLTPMLIGKLFGTAHLGAITGLINAAHFLGGGFWAFMAGLIFDRTGNYQLTFMLSALLAFVAVVSMVFVRERKH
jgi:MFS family permease